MRHDDVLDMSLAQLMAAWPSTLPVFIAHRMKCIGCPISPFHTLPDAASEHGLELAALVAEIEARMADEPRGDPARSRRR